MSDDSDLYRAYVVSHETYYWPSMPADMRREQSILVQLASTDGGVKWEFEVTQRGTIGPQVQMFSDAWAAFEDVPDLFKELRELGGDGRGAVTLDDVRAVLDRLGFKDDTQRDRARR